MQQAFITTTGELAAEPQSSSGEEGGDEVAECSGLPVSSFSLTGPNDKVEVEIWICHSKESQGLTVATDVDVIYKVLVKKSF